MQGERAHCNYEHVVALRFIASVAALVLAMCACDTPTKESPELEECREYAAALEACFGPKVAADVRAAWVPTFDGRIGAPAIPCGLLAASKRLRDSCR